MKADQNSSAPNEVLCAVYLPSVESGGGSNWKRCLPEKARVRRRAAAFAKGLTAWLLGAAACGVVLHALRQSAPAVQAPKAPTIERISLGRQGAPVIVYESLADARLHAESLNQPTDPEFFLATGTLGRPASEVLEQP